MLPKPVRLNGQQKKIMEEAFVSFMHFAPFFSYYFYDQMEVHYTEDMQTCATDGRRIFVNPTYFCSLKPMERAFALAHEVYHVIYKHPTRMKFYRTEGNLKGLPWDQELFNIAADYVINADLVDSAIGTINPAWLYDANIKASELAEDVYVKLFKQKPPPPPPPPVPTIPNPNCPPTPTNGQSQGQSQKPQPTTGSQGGQQPSNLPAPKTHGQHSGRKAGHDKEAQSNGGRFDEIMEPHQDAGSGKEDLPSDMEFKEAVARAEVAAKRAGNMPANLQRVVKDIVDPQVYWKDHLRLKITGKVGSRRETWVSPNRRRLVLNPFVYMPGRQGHGAELITVVIDNSGSIGNRELTAFFSETAAILNDCKPKRVQVIWCDMDVRRVEEARSLDELLHIRTAPGGGGTSFRPPLKYLVDNRIVPDTLVYLTDMYPNDGWPDEPEYPVIWCATTSIDGPFGETVHIKV